MRLLPQSLFGRLLAFLAGGLTLAQLLSAALLLQDRDQALYHAVGGHAQRIAAIVNLLDSLEDVPNGGDWSPRWICRRLTSALICPGNPLPSRMIATKPPCFSVLLQRQLGPNRPFQVEITDDLPPPPPFVDPPRRGSCPSLQTAGHDPRMPGWRRHAMMMGLRNFVVQARLHDGAVATFQQMLPEEVIAWPLRLLLTLLIVLVSVAGLAALAVRTLTRPLAVLADAATDLGRDIRRPALAETGPLEVRRGGAGLQHDAEPANPLP